MSGGIVDNLLKSDEPCVRYKVRVNVLGEDPNSRAIKRLRTRIRRSSRVQALMSEATKDAPPPHHPYGKWYGAHWIMASLADIGYPPGNKRFIPWRERVYTWHFARGSRRGGIPCIDGRYRRCASQEGNTVYYLLALGLADERTDELVERLIGWQWPDGGWNCDKKPKAVNSSFHESLIPLRALSLHARTTGSKRSAAAAKRAARIFLKRRMFRRQRDGQIMNGDFVTLHYPCYWHYDVLSGLKVMAEAGIVGDRRCREALDWLESKQLPGGGWPAEAKYWRVSRQRKSGTDLVSWGPTGRTRMNEFVTAEALFVLRASGRLSV
ncbi:MAG: prenyltransferase/squalene oxidase repeat-containing protein [Planctomycetota bacterium]|jgi:hypothetical protein